MTTSSQQQTARPLTYPQIVAHRGDSAAFPEHTEASYRSAIDLGVEALECDVRATADGHLVCVHDGRIDRTSNGRGRVSTMTLAQLQAHDFASWAGPSAGTGGVLTLPHLIELALAAPQRIELAIETKHPTRFGGFAEQQLVRILRHYGLLAEDAGVRVMSFSAVALRRVRERAPGLPTVYLVDRVPLLLRSGQLPFDARIAGPSIEIVRDHPEALRRWQRAGHDVHVWTVDTREDVELCMRSGVTAVITNRPAEAMRWRDEIWQDHGQR